MQVEIGFCSWSKTWDLGKGSFLGHGLVIFINSWLVVLQYSALYTGTL